MRLTDEERAQCVLAIEHLRIASNALLVLEERIRAGSLDHDDRMNGCYVADDARASADDARERIEGLLQ